MAGVSDILRCAGPAEWGSWLAAHWQQPGGVWLQIGRRGSGVASLTAGEALDVALCYGWIGGTRRRLDGDHFLQWYAPRTPRSTWSKVNVDRVEALIAAGRMRPPGLAQVEAARADGRWAAAYPSQRHATVPSDLLDALDYDHRARAAFESLAPSARYAVMLPVLRARTSEQRARRARVAVSRLAAG
ncbi:MAG: YdeI/OmpD-associated family protein [Candidatus Dormibacteraeota bacterium]|nr:YdeI/OmpD-associated family protein [Candidatus Dormibacteraeota bacterium]